jgi:hypothetical protein
MHRQGFTMTEATVTTQIHESFNIHGNFGSKGSLYLAFIVYDLSNTIYFRLRQTICFGIRADVELG